MCPGCPNLKSFRCEATTPPDIDAWTFDKVNKSNFTIYVPKPVVSAYKAAEIWKDYKIVGYDNYVIYGDVDGDDIVNVSDVTALVSRTVGSASYTIEHCDINYDNVVDVSDITALIAIMLGGN